MKKFTLPFFLLLFGISSSVFAQVPGQDWIKLTTSTQYGETIRLGVKVPPGAADPWIDLNNNGVREEPQENLPPGFDEMAYDEYVIQSNTIYVYGHIYDLDCANNDIVAIDVEGNPNIRRLYCQDNLLSELDVSGKDNLISLHCDNNRLSELNLSGADDLYYLHCQNNNLKSLDASSCDHLDILYCQNNQIENLQLHGDFYIDILDCSNNKLSQFEIPNGSRISVFNCSYNYLMSLDLSNQRNEDIDELNAFGNPACCIRIDEGFTPPGTWQKDATATYSTSACQLTNTPRDGLPSINMTVINGTEIDFSLKAPSDNMPIWITYGTETDLITANTSWSEHTYTVTSGNELVIHGFVEDFICEGNSSRITGIETINNSLSYALKSLWCGNNGLQTLNVRLSKGLQDLKCFNNQLSDLNVSGLNELNTLSCQNNSLTELIMTDCESLELLNCSNNLLTEIYTRYLPLENFKCYNNRIAETLTVWSDVLSYLDCSHNNIEDASIVSNALVSINCSYNLIRALNLSTQTSLRQVICNNNQLQYLNVASGNNTNFVGNTEDIAFDSRGNDKLSCIVIDSGFTPPSTGDNKWMKDSNHYYSSSDCGPPASVPFIYLTVSENASVNVAFNGVAMGTPVWIEKTPGIYERRTVGSAWGEFKPPYQVTGTILRFYGEIARFDCSDNDAKISYLETSPNTTLTRLDCQDNSLTGIDISASTGLTWVDCQNNQLPHLDVGFAQALENLSCRNNQIETLNIDNCGALEYLHCDINRIESLDVSLCTVLQWLNCSYNQIIDLNVSSCTDLEVLEVNNNQIRTISIANNPNLVHLDCANNALGKLKAANGNNQNFIGVGNVSSSSFAFKASGNPNLSCIQIDNDFNPPTTGNNKWIKDESAEWSEVACPNSRINIVSVSGSGNIRLRINAEPEYQSGVWIDLNNNLQRDSGEDVTVFGEYANYTKASQTTILYGNVKELHCNSNWIQGLYTGWNPYLQKLNCSDNIITELNFWNNADLSYLDCNKNALSELDITQNEILDTLNCSLNSIGELDLSQNANLLFLNCNKNSMSEIDACQNLFLQKLFCQENDLTRIRVPYSDHFVYLNCAGNNLDACALNEVYSEVKNRIILSNKGYIFVETATLNNPGTDISKTSLTNNKKWQVSGIDQFSMIYPITGDGSGCNVSGVSLNENSLDLIIGETATLIESVEPAYAGNQIVLWTSDNSSIADVTSEGLVTAKYEGKAVITVTTADGGFTSDCIVRVSNDTSLVVPTNFQVSSTTLTENETECFNAINIIEVAGDGTQVSVEFGASATFIAGQSIRFLPGFHAQVGSYVDAHISTDASFCDGFVVESIVAAPPVVEKSIEIEENDEIQQNPFDEKQIKLYPNPNNGRFTLETKNFGEQKLIVVYNMAGSIVYRIRTYNNEPLQLELPIGVSGIYNLRVSDGKTAKGVKMIVR